MALRFRGRKALRLGPRWLHVALNFTERGFTSWGIRIGRYGHNFTRGAHSLDTPGWGGLRWGGGRRR
jgi:hypothetical protein